MADGRGGGKRGGRRLWRQFALGQQPLKRVFGQRQVGRAAACQQRQHLGEWHAGPDGGSVGVVVIDANGHVAVAGFPVAPPQQDAGRRSRSGRGRSQ